MVTPFSLDSSQLLWDSFTSSALATITSVRLLLLWSYKLILGIFEVNRYVLSTSKVINNHSQADDTCTNLNRAFDLEKTHAR